VNAFQHLLNDEFFQCDAKSKREEHYLPLEKTLKKLDQQHPDLVPFFNAINPFHTSFHYKKEEYQKMALRMQRLFPLSAAVIQRVGERGKQVILTRWKNEIRRHLSHSFSSLLPEGHNLYDECFFYVMLDPFIDAAEAIIFYKNSHAASSLLLTISFRAAEVSTSIHEDAKNLALWHVRKKLLEKNEEMIRSYPHLAYKPLDEGVEKALTGTDFSFSCTFFKELACYLPFLTKPKNTLLESVYETCEDLLLQLKFRARLDMPNPSLHRRETKTLQESLNHDKEQLLSALKTLAAVNENKNKD
jgi:hypothetical protein